MPFHYYVCVLLIKNTEIDNLWRDVLIIFMLLICMMENNGSMKKNGIYIATSILVILLFAIGSSLLNGYQGIWNICRTYTIPLLVYYAASSVSITRGNLTKLLRYLIYILTGIGVYGFFQAFFLGDSFLLKLGYEGAAGHLSSYSFYIGGFFGHQRSTGTFVSPNVLGAIMAICLCITLFSCIDLGIKHKNILIILQLIGIVATFSRSAIVAFAIAFIIQHLFAKRGKIRFSKKRFLIVLISILLGFMMIMIIDNRYLNGLLGRMIRSSFGSAASGTDFSYQKHMEDIYQPLEIVLQHPFGLGFGNNGPMALELSNSANTVESSFYLMMYETGLLFGLFFFIPMLRNVFLSYRNKKQKFYASAAASVSMLIVFLLLPSVQTFEILFYIYLLIGFYDNKCVSDIIAAELETDIDKKECAERAS